MSDLSFEEILKYILERLDKLWLELPEKRHLILALQRDFVSSVRNDDDHLNFHTKFLLTSCIAMEIAAREIPCKTKEQVICNGITDILMILIDLKEFRC